MWTFLGKVMSLLLNMLSTLVLAFLPRSKCLLTSWLQSPSAKIFGPQESKVCYCFHCFLIYLPWSDVTSCQFIIIVKKINERPKNWCFWTVVLEKTLESPSDCKEIKPVNPKGYQSWIFIGRTDAEAETPVLWPPNVKNWLICKDPDAGKDWRQEEKEMTEDKMVGWHNQLNGHESE